MYWYNKISITSNLTYILSVPVNVILIIWCMWVLVYRSVEVLKFVFLENIRNLIKIINLAYDFEKIW